jgi:hypothetical protein
LEPTQLQELNNRINKLEKRDVQDLLTLLELMSNVHFFGGMKKTNCEFAKNGQCALFYLRGEAKSKIPSATECKIAECETHDHFHLETSNVTCTFCPQWSHRPSFPGYDSQMHGEKASDGIDGSRFISKRI